MSARLSDDVSHPYPSGVDVWIATGAYAGRSPLAPGTVGSLWGIPLTLGIWLIPSNLGRGLVALLICAGGIPLCTSVARKLGRKDPGAIVWDEIASMPLVFMFVSDTAMSQPLVWVMGFALHRLFDIVKPPPVRWLERLPDGLGIMADDCAAALYACLVLNLILHLGVLR